MSGIFLRYNKRWVFFHYNKAVNYRIGAQPVLVDKRTGEQHAFANAWCHVVCLPMLCVDVGSGVVWIGGAVVIISLTSLS